MSRRGNCHDNAVAESFFRLLKHERIKKKIYGTREAARSDIFDYIKMLITAGVGMVRAIRCHWQNMKTNIINSPDVSGLSVVIQLLDNALMRQSPENLKLLTEVVSQFFIFN